LDWLWEVAGLFAKRDLHPLSNLVLEEGEVPMRQTRNWIGLAIAVAILAIGWSNAASATPGACKPVKVCEAVKPLPPACQPVKRISPPLPACQPVKACERVDGHVRYAKHEKLHEVVAVVLTAPKRLVAHHREHHGRYVLTNGVELQQTVPSGEPKSAPATAPQSIPPAPSPTRT
jgi:hypothetical protein